MDRLDVKTVRLIVAVVVVAAVAVFGAVKLFGGDDDEGDSACPGNPVALSEDELVAKAADLPHVSYWIGPLPTAESYELSDVDGRIYVRYLTGGADACDQRGDFITVGTYPTPGAVDALHAAADAGGTQGVEEKDGYTLSKGTGLNAYVVFDDQPDLQIEVYAPGEGDAVELATSGALKPIE